MVRAIADAIGPEKTAIRLSPGFPTGGIAEGRDNDDLYCYLAAEFDKMGLANLHVLHARNEALLADIRKGFGGMLDMKGMRFPTDVILVCIRWYAVYPLSCRHDPQRSMHDGRGRNDGVRRPVLCFGRTNPSSLRDD